MTPASLPAASATVAAKPVRTTPRAQQGAAPRAEPTPTASAAPAATAAKPASEPVSPNGAPILR
jgi:hypothetical protein